MLQNHSSPGTLWSANAPFKPVRNPETPLPGSGYAFLGGDAVYFLVPDAH
jgi:hypothetical protein